LEKGVKIRRAREISRGFTRECGRRVLNEIRCICNLFPELASGPPLRTVARRGFSEWTEGMAFLPDEQHQDGFLLAVREECK
jgi:hypothetical protein